MLSANCCASSSCCGVSNPATVDAAVIPVRIPFGVLKNLNLN